MSSTEKPAPTLDASQAGQPTAFHLVAGSEMRELLLARAWAKRHDINGHEGPNRSLNYEDGWDDAMQHINDRIGVAVLGVIAELQQAGTPNIPQQIAACLRGCFSLPNAADEARR